MSENSESLYCISFNGCTHIYIYIYVCVCIIGLISCLKYILMSM